MDIGGEGLRVLAAIALVGLLPWLSAAGSGIGVFGFPWPSFAMLIAGPLLLAIVARTGGDDRDEPDG